MTCLKSMTKKDWARLSAAVTVCNGLLQLKFPSEKPGMRKTIEVNGVTSKPWTAVQYGLMAASIGAMIGWIKTKPASAD